MAFDGITIAAMVRELNNNLAGGRINKIAQPEVIGFHIKQTTPYLCPKPSNSIRLLILHEVGLLLISDKQKLNRYVRNTRES